MEILKFLFIILEVVVLFNLIIIVHELGHFLAARWRGLVVDRFGIWFGKPIWQKKINGVVYCLGSIPAGGYVALPQMAPMELIEGKNESGPENLPPIAPRDKIIVAFAGPLFSFTLALLFAAVVWIIGRPVSESETTTVVGYVLKDSPAQKAGIRPGDKILEVDGHRVTKYAGIGDSIMWRIITSQGPTVPIKVERDGQVHLLQPVPIKEETKSWMRKRLRQILIMPAQTPMIAKVIPDSPAALAGLQPSDLIKEVNGVPLFQTATLSDYIEAHGPTNLTLKVERGGKDFEVTLRPELPVNEKVPRIGIFWDMTGNLKLAYPTPIEQIHSSVTSMTSTLGALFSRKSDIKAQHLSGPVGIMRVYYLLFESEQGWRLAIWFSVLLNVNLAILNMLPIPVLDGGHIMLAMLEGLRRKPVNMRVLNFIQSACAVLIIGYMLYVTFYDFQDLSFKREKDNKEQEMKFAPKRSDSAPP